MMEQEADRAIPAQEETTAESPETTASQAQEMQESALNPRIRVLRDARDAANLALQEAILDLETREQSPAFQKAKELYDQGFRLKPFLGDGFYVYGPADIVRQYTYGDVELERYEVTSYEREDSDQTDDRQSVYAALDIKNREDREDVIRHFADLTAEKL